MDHTQTYDSISTVKMAQFQQQIRITHKFESHHLLQHHTAHFLSEFQHFQKAANSVSAENGNHSTNAAVLSGKSNLDTIVVKMSISIPDENKEANEAKQELNVISAVITKKDIPSRHILAVQAICRLWYLAKQAPLTSNFVNAAFIPIQIEDLMLFYYAKPLKMNVMKLGNADYEVVLIDGVDGNWNYITSRVMCTPSSRRGYWFASSGPRTWCSKPAFYNYLQCIDAMGNTTNVFARDWPSFTWNEEDDRFKVITGQTRQRGTDEDDKRYLCSMY